MFERPFCGGGWLVAFGEAVDDCGGEILGGARVRAEVEAGDWHDGVQGWEEK